MGPKYCIHKEGNLHCSANQIDNLQAQKISIQEQLFSHLPLLIQQPWRFGNIQFFKSTVWGQLLECVDARFPLFTFMTYLCPGIEAGVVPSFSKLIGTWLMACFQPDRPLWFLVFEASARPLADEIPPSPLQCICCVLF